VSQRELKNIPASVRARLLNEARARGESYDQVLQYFAIERFLYRLSKTEWGERLVVKGAIMLRAWGTPLGRRRETSTSSATWTTRAMPSSKLSERALL
jgi:hypothetical protein